MEIDFARIPIDKSPEEIKDFIQYAIKSGKLKQWKIFRIEMQTLIKDNEFEGIMYQSESGAYPKLFAISKNNSEADRYSLSISIQNNY